MVYLGYLIENPVDLLLVLEQPAFKEFISLILVLVHVSTLQQPNFISGSIPFLHRIDFAISEIWV